MDDWDLDDDDKFDMDVYYDIDNYEEMNILIQLVMMTVIRMIWIWTKNYVEYTVMYNGWWFYNYVMDEEELIWMIKMIWIFMIDMVLMIKMMIWTTKLSIL